MGCEQFRELLSACLDGEDSLAERAATDIHLAECSACRRWYEAAARITRLARTGPARTNVRVDDMVLDAAPGPAGARLVTVLRLLLGTLGIAQFLLGAAQIGGSTVAHRLHSASADAGGHLWHESAAWNVAIGAGFAWIALRRTRPAGIVPMLTVFVGVLSLLTTNDLIAGRVDLARVLSHGIVAAGYVVILVMSRLGGGSETPPADRQDSRRRWRATFDPEPPPVPDLRLISGQSRPSGTAHACAGERRAA
ncbi:zf-HC2 domain-containing protein [Micromonospora sp. WMMD1102]|nr:zf-HC2 domain-containing protein [Micromonospora sp. WMMD1102]MDG4785024.1 zf-HC2 domain-containing protein [Micromonospora sp. WMMD1102]